jgi:FAD/FMN-containing dehydrogenase
MPIHRRKFLKGAILLPSVLTGASSAFAGAGISFDQSKKLKRVRPGDALWPSNEKWLQLSKSLDGKLIKLESPLAACKTESGTAACEELFKNLKNPYYIGDTPALTQTSGYLDAWDSKPSAYAVAVNNTADVVAAVNFARIYNLRLVVKGGGHSYQGTSNSADSLLVWTRAMNKIDIHENFVAQGCALKEQPQPAVTVEAGAVWMHVYDAVTTKAGRYVQGGGCGTVGVAGLIQSGGFGNFSKNYGLAAAALLQAEVVTADGLVKVANACTNPDLFWALKGGGGGSFGVVTKVTLRTRELPANFGAVFGSIKANDDASYKKLIQQILRHYKSELLNPHWGESISFQTDNSVDIGMVFHGLTQQEAKASWQALEDWVKESPLNYSFQDPLTIIAIPARHLWDSSFLRNNAPHLVAMDDRPQAPSENVYWAGDQQQSGQFLFGYHSAWLPISLLPENKQDILSDAIFAASRNWSLALHFNKGLAGAPEKEIEAARNTAINPAVLNAFALVIIAGNSNPAFTGLEGHKPDMIAAKKYALRISKAMDEILKIVPDAGSYVSESSFFLKNWQRAFWGSNYARLATIKKKYDPEGLFFVHHGVGCEEWSADGFSKL